jgi:hypothetical protein
MLWALFIVAFIPNSINFANGIGYALWLLIDILTMLCCHYYLSKSGDFSFCVRAYMLSFFVNALIGILQFITSLLGASFFTTQGKFGVFQRLNGFCFEPSYYATYLIVGWVMCAYLIEKRLFIFPKRRQYLIFAAISFSLLMSTSRMGWLMMIGWYLLWIGRVIIGRRITRRAAISVLVAMVFILLALLVFYINRDAIINSKQFRELTFGLGVLAGQADHSVSSRIKRIDILIRAFRTNIWIGTSLGGVDPALAKELGINYTTGVNGAAIGVTLEVLMASGIVGFIIFTAFMLKLYKAPRKLVRRQLSRTASEITLLNAMLLAFIFQFIMLQFNQNILRVYFWINIGVLMGIYDYCKSKLGRSTANSLVIGH